MEDRPVRALRDAADSTRRRAANKSAVPTSASRPRLAAACAAVATTRRKSSLGAESADLASEFGTASSAVSSSIGCGSGQWRSRCARVTPPDASAQQRLRIRRETWPTRGERAPIATRHTRQRAPRPALRPGGPLRSSDRHAYHHFSVLVARIAVSRRGSSPAAIPAVGRRGRCRLSGVRGRGRFRARW